ncbi:hypothetical protein KGF56_003088 [Candida oxycetoniae]|uniref:Uncharacterized protein n=1 Tax=Candida oxycetoniae TaxID=497107 RepID=A0AAI9SW47_9ASCO|nr:uncharacterized protein KGF56_003088 [Candida oxycetoniae]KAI3404052.2 hypothetical protein KGF56_003088 [Candida oxycetoniae]
MIVTIRYNKAKYESFENRYKKDNSFVPPTSLSNNQSIESKRRKTRANIDQTFTSIGQIGKNENHGYDKKPFSDPTQEVTGNITGSQSQVLEAPPPSPPRPITPSKIVKFYYNGGTTSTSKISPHRLNNDKTLENNIFNSDISNDNSIAVLFPKTQRKIARIVYPHTPGGRGGGGGGGGTTPDTYNVPSSVNTPGSNVSTNNFTVTTEETTAMVSVSSPGLLNLSDSSLSSGSSSSAHSQSSSSAHSSSPSGHSSPIKYQPQSSTPTCEKAIDKMDKYSDVVNYIADNEGKDTIQALREAETEWLKNLVVVANRLNYLKDLYKVVEVVKKKKLGEETLSD